MQYVGAIDMNGLDSFSQADPTDDLLKIWSGKSNEEKNDESDTTKTLLHLITMRARSNEQDHCVPFIAEFEEGSLGYEAAKMLEDRDLPWDVNGASLVLRGAKVFAIARGFTRHWDLLQRLVPDYTGETSNEVYKPRTLESLREGSD